MRYLAPAIVLLFATGCGTTKITKTGPPQTSRGLACEFDIYTAAPSGKFQEVGSIDVNPGGYGHNTFNDLSDFKEEIRPTVCQAGGDGAIAFANGYGYWIKATVIKRTAEAPQPEAAVAVVPAVASEPPAPAAGCTYDTQCKGDRVCESGKCVSPAVLPASED